jgi:DNA-binding SARP family transcriptional activator/pimeloyl-ACP methyl ester carboxylesterase
MEFRLLGPLEAREGDRVLALGGGKQRALLARLLLEANRVVAVERLVDDLWGEAPPDTAPKMVQVYVSKLRKVLPPNRLLTRRPGYLMAVEPGELDLERLERLLATGREALAADRPEAAAEAFREALGLWRGPALAEFAEPFAAHEAGRLEQVRLSCLEERVEAELALARHGQLVGELESLVSRYPLRERLRGQQMLALYRAGRQAEALAAYREARRAMDEELGIEPSPALRELEQQILRQDPALAPGPLRAGPVPSGEEASRSRPSGATPVATAPPVRYARSDDVRIAYQVVGEGELDLVLVHGWVCTFQPGWENPRIERFYRRLASLGRLILFDKRGTGLSDRVSADRLPNLETRMDDVRAVMDAVGSERAVVLGVSEGGSMSALFAATHPERTVALALMGAFARMLRGPDYPIGVSPEDYRKRLESGEQEDWARAVTLEWLGRVAPGILADDEAVSWYVSYVMRGASPGGSQALRLMNAEIDIRHVLPAIGVPTLVLCRAGEYFREGMHYMAERIPGARLVELPGNDHLPWEGDQEAVLDAIESFVSEVRGDEVELDRVLATVLFADVVGSAEKAAELGDRAWKELLGRYRGRARAQLDRYRGREIGAAGEGMLATFDGPARAIRCACAIARDARPLGLEVRAGLHTGEIELSNGDIRGIAVQTGSQVAAQAQPGEILVSRTVRDLVAGSGIDFEERGTHALEGVPGEWELLAVKTG